MSARAHRVFVARALLRTLLGVLLAGALAYGCERQPPAPEAAAEANVGPEPVSVPEDEDEEEDTVRLTVVYDNNTCPGAGVSGLQTDWGFACWVEAGDSTVLFDTGGNGAILLSNLNRLGLDPAAIDAVVLSHAHGDHTGGLAALLDTGARPTVYLLDTFPARLKRTVRSRTALVEVSAPMEVAPGVYSTGRVDGEIPEQALVVQSGDGLLVITGCAHPGVVKMVARACEAVAGEVALVLGGFHLGSASQGKIRQVGEGLEAQGVQHAAPCHCTGDLARRMLTDQWGRSGLLPGVGWVYEPQGRD